MADTPMDEDELGFHGSAAADEWELCKENVQPLRQGRTFANMSAAVQHPNSIAIKKQQE